MSDNLNRIGIRGSIAARTPDYRYTLPEGGNPGDIPVKTETGVEWQQPEPATTTPDYNQNDETASDYIKNRPFYKIEGFNWGEEHSVTVENKYYYAAEQFVGDVRGTYDGTPFEFDMDNQGEFGYWGKKEFDAGTSDVYFRQNIALWDSNGSIYTRNGDSHTVVYQFGNEITKYVQIDPEFIPAVTESKIATGAVTRYKIADRAIINTKIAAGAVTDYEIAEGAVTTYRIAERAVTNDRIAAKAVDSAEIADEAVTSSKIASGAVTADKIANGVIPTQVQSDWGQSTENDLGYVKNRTHYTKPGSVAFVDNLTITASVIVDGNQFGRSGAYDEILGATVTDYSGHEYKITTMNTNRSSDWDIVFHDTLDEVMMVRINKSDTSISGSFRSPVISGGQLHTLSLNNAKVGCYYRPAYCTKVTYPETVVQLDEKYIPTITADKLADGVLPSASKLLPTVTASDSGKFLRVSESGAWEAEAISSEMILASSTPGSTKKFKITVDDSGTISATEVTE